MSLLRFVFKEAHMPRFQFGQEGLCHAKTELLRAYQNASVRYSKAVCELSHNVGLIPEVEFEYLRSLAGRARKVCRAAQKALRAHIVEHHCESRL